VICIDHSADTGKATVISGGLVDTSQNIGGGGGGVKFSTCLPKGFLCLSERGSFDYCICQMATRPGKSMSVYMGKCSP
jgi:hypothetical protein